MTSQPDTYILEVVELTKSFGELIANDRVSFSVQKGHVHCLLGENGAGKSTLAKCIYGVSQPDSGKIIYKGQEMKFSSPREAIRVGIGIVSQHFVLAGPMNAVENIVVGEESPGHLLRLADEKKKIQALCDQYGLTLDLNSPVSRLSVGQQQWVEILKALYAGVDLLILDEPTAVLTPQEVENLFAIIHKMTSEGLSIILVTHKMHEVMSVSDRVTVLRKGKVVTTVDTASNTRSSLAKLLVGRDFDFVVHKEKIDCGPPVLEIQNICVRRDNGTMALQDVSLTVHGGEILGLAGVSGNGQSELYDTLVGVRPAEQGRILLNRQDVTHLSPAVLANRGLASVPQDRLKQGLIEDFTIEENLVLGLHGNQPYCRAAVLNWNAIDDFAQQAIENFEIKASGPKQIVHQLSGGNLQKVILAREISHNLKAMVVSSPTRGLDINATYYVYGRFLDLLKSGVAILMISEDLDEIFNVSDRIAVLYNGRVMGQFDVRDATREKIGLLMAGVEEDDHS